MSIEISIIIPCYNEEGNINAIGKKLIAEMVKFKSYEIIFIDDGSEDKTLKAIKNLSLRNRKIKYISFSRNFGHQNALRAGLARAKGNCVISMDADLQHPPAMIGDMIKKWREGYKIVYTKRSDSKKLFSLKNLTSAFFYSFLNKISGLSLDRGAADFRLLDRKVVEVIKNTEEPNLFLRGFISWVGFKKCALTYHPEQRYSGETKYSFKRMVLFALQGITSYSIKPLHISTFFGISIFLLSFFYGFYALFIYFFTDKTISGWTSMIVSILFIGGVQLVALGIIGEYLGKLFIESKRRPDYIIEEDNL